MLYEVEKLRAKIFNNRKSASSTFINEDADSTTHQSLFLNTFTETNFEQEITSSSDFITKHMIEFRQVFFDCSFFNILMFCINFFRSIDEIQKQNQKLIRYAREITEHKESEEKAELELKTKEYNLKLDMAFRQMEEFKAQREKQEQMFEEICKQRDTYKQLLTQLQAQQQQQEEQQQERLIQTEALEKEKISDEAVNNLKKLEHKFEKYKNEIMETNRLLNQEIDNYRKSLNEINTKYALSESRLEGTVEKCKTLNATVEKYKKECETLKERNSKFSELIVKHEQSLTTLNLELHKSKEKQGELEAHLRSLTVERDLFKSNQDRLTVENQILTRENQSRSLILQNLETIRSSCERNEREHKLMYQDKIDGLEKENIIMRKRLETDEEQKKLIQKSFEAQLKELNSRLETEMKERENSREDLRKIEDSYEATKNKLVEVEAKLHSSEQLIQMTRNAKSSTTISRLTELEEHTKDLQMKLSLSEKEIVNLKIQLEDTKTHAKQYSTIAENMEKTLKESSETFEKTKKILEERIINLESEKTNLGNEYNHLEGIKKSLEIELKNEKEISENRIKMLTNDLTNSFKELSDKTEKLNQTEIVLNERTKDRDEYVAQIRILEEQISAEINKSNEFKAQIDAFNECIREKDEAYLRLEKDNLLNSRLYNEITEQLKNTENIFKEKYENLENENKQLIKQIDTLQDELNRLSESIQILQKDTLSTSFKAFDEKILVDETPTPNEEEETTKRRESFMNLLEINRFLREQKEQLEKNYQNLSLEHEITGQRLIKIENEFNFNKEKLQIYENEIESLKIRTSMMSSNANIDDYNLIVDTNKRLKEQYDSVTVELNETCSKLKHLDDEICQIKSEKHALDIEKETLLGEKAGMQMEIKRWKDRVDSLIRNSDIGDEWVKAQKEVSELQEQTQILTDMINDLRKNLTNATNEKEILTKEYEAFKVTRQEEMNKNLTDLENLKQERSKKEEVFRLLVTELKDIVLTVQKELDINDYEWVSKLKMIKEELSVIKKAIIEKIKATKEEIKNKSISLTEANKKISELNESIKLSNEQNDKKIKELEEEKKVVQDKALKAVEYSKGNILKLRQEIKELKTINQDLQSSSSSVTQSQVISTIITAPTASSATASTPIQSGKLLSTTSTIVQSATLSSISSGSSPTASTPPIQNIENVQSTTAPPTAYIAPSRVNKITPLNTRPTLITGFGDTSKRTAAVQPTTHELKKSNQLKLSYSRKLFKHCLLL